MTTRTAGRAGRAADPAAAPNATLRQLAAFAGLVAFYLLTAPSNQSLIVDAYSYAGKIATCAPFDIDQPRQLLWIAAMQGLYCPLVAIAPGIDLFAVVGAASAAFSAAAVLLFARVAECDLGVDRTAAVLAAALYAATYAVWRYATAVEVYAAAALLALLLLHLAMGVARRGGPPLAVAGLGLVGGVAALTYQPLALLTAVVVPLLVMGTRRAGPAVIFVAVAGVIIAGGFGGAAAISRYAAGADAVTFVLEQDRLSPALPGPGALARAAYAIGHDIFATYWVFGFDALRDAIVRAAPDRYFAEEVLAATAAGAVARAGATTFGAALALGLIVVATALRRGRQPRRSLTEGVLILWLAAHAAMMLILSPGGFEGWILALIPILLIAARRLVAPALATGRGLAARGLVAVLVLHNGLTGIVLQDLPEGDYLAQRGAPMMAAAGPGDLIVIASDWTLYKHLLFQSRARVLQVPETSIVTVEVAMRATLDRGGAVVVNDLAFDPPPSLAVGDPALADALRTFGDRWRGRAKSFPTGRAGQGHVIAAPVPDSGG